MSDRFYLKLIDANDHISGAKVSILPREKEVRRRDRYLFIFLFILR